MVLPKIFEKILNPKEKKPEYFLALQIKSQKVKVALWEKQEEQIKIAGIGGETYSGEWKEIIKAADSAIINASGNLPQEEIEKVIFGLPPSWTQENKIIPSRLAGLKTLCSELSLKPLGFVINPEALVHYLRQVEGGPPTAILVGQEKIELTITLVKVGKIEGTRTEFLDEGVNPAELVTRSLKSFPDLEILPSRVLLYSGEDLGDLKEELISYPWTQKLPFLHFPKIEILEKDVEIRALALASAAQMGAEIEFEERPTIPEQEEGKTEETLGFVKNEDILEKEVPQEPPAPKTPPSYLEEQKKPEFISPQEIPQKGLKLPHFKFPFRLHFGSFEFLGKMKWIFLILILTLIIGGGIGVAAFWYLPRAQLQILVEAKNLEKETEIIINPSLTLPDEGAKQIPGKTVEVEESGTKKTQATGKKNVGDPAKGEITVYNKTENEKRFPQGTVVLGPNNLKFTLDEEVTVASTSPFSTTFSNVKVKVTASQVGPESNLGAEINFSFKDFPATSYFAKNEKEFSGGTSREISIVDKADQERLMSTLAAELTEKAKADLEGKLGEGEKLIEKTFTSTTKQKKFDKEANEETKELSLTLSMTFKSLVFGEKDLKGILIKMMQKEVPPGYELREEQMKVEISSVEAKKDGTATLKTTFSANLLPKLDLEEIKKNIAGKYPQVAQDYLQNLGSVIEVKITLARSFPWRLRTLPRLPQNIKIEVVSK